MASLDAVRSLREGLDRQPRVRLAMVPTPLEPAPRLTRALGGPTIYLKRDDLTGLALGGNKVRQLEFLLGDALRHRATAILTGAGVQSNHCRQVAAACAKLGLRTCLVLRGEAPSKLEGNFLLDTLFGAECRFVPNERFYGEFDRIVAEWADDLASQNERPYVINTLGWDSPSCGLAALAYVEVALELEEQFRALAWRPDALFVCSGAATQAGLLVAQKLLDLPYRLIGVSASPFIPDKPLIMARIARRAAALIGFDLAWSAEEITNLDAYVGPGYGEPTPDSITASHLVARTEGVLLDPVYTSKAFAALIDHIKRGLVRPDERVLFLHTGGMPGIFLSQHAHIAVAGMPAAQSAAF